MERSDSSAPAIEGGQDAHTAWLLEVDNLTTGYGNKTVLQEASLTVAQGETVAIIGHNGAGKTTLLRSVFGLQRRWSGEVRLDGQTLGASHDASTSVAKGMAMIPAEHFVFPDMTVRDNLRLSARALTAEERTRRIDESCRDYPVLGERIDQLAGTMSGGEQRMVSLSMALMSAPRLLLLDEPSLGLSPLIVDQLMGRVRDLTRDGVGVVLVEQNVAAALSVATRIYVLRSGRVIDELSSTEMIAMGREKWWDLF